MAISASEYVAVPAPAPSMRDEGDTDYEPPLLVDLGPVRDVVLGNSSSGNGDANSQYYW